PRVMTRLVLTSPFDKPLPLWVDEGVVRTSIPLAEQTKLDRRCRELLAAGRGGRLRVLFRMNELPADSPAVQGHHAARFLLLRVRDNRPLGVEPWRNENQRLLAFVTRGMAGDTVDSWNRAANEVYGFDSVDALEVAWLDWLKKPQSE